MDNVTFVDVTDSMTDKTTTHAIIKHTDGSQTSMLKSTYDEMIAAQASLNPTE